MRRTLAALMLFTVCAACGGGGGEGNDDALEPGESPKASAGTPSVPDDVTAASKNGVNRPKAGSYVYDFSGSSTNAARPTASPVTAPAGASFTSKVTFDDDRATTVEQTSFGSTVATTVTRYADDGIQEVSLQTKSSAGTAGCVMQEPIQLIRLPLKAESYPKQSYDGEGIACDRDKTIEIEGLETAVDADGHVWPAWKIVIKTVGRSVGLREEFTETKWFSADLGKDIKTEVATVGLDANGKESYRAETSTLLTSYPAD